MITRIKSDRIFTPDGWFAGYLYFDENKILCVTKDELNYDCAYDFSGLYVSPGFIDMHVHGGDGEDFCSSDAAGIARAANLHLRHGTTTIMPTITSVTYDAICRSLDAMRESLSSGAFQARFGGVHLEGPYFSPEMCGAQNPESIKAPDSQEYTKLITQYGDLIRRWSYAPEYDRDARFARYLTSHGIIPSMGHSAALYEDCLTAYDAGCRLVTHLFSCTSTITRRGGFRQLGIIEASWLLDDLDVEIIADGKHLPKDLIRMIIKIKGFDRVSLVTDAIRVAGSTQTQGSIGGVHFIVEDGVAKLPDRSAFAGSIATADRLLYVCVKEAGFSVQDALRMITANPARILGINAGAIAFGYLPDIVVFDDDISIKAVFAGGKSVL